MILESALFLLTQISAIDQPQRIRELERVYAVSIQRMAIVEIDTLRWPPSFEWLYYSPYLPTLTGTIKQSPQSDAEFRALSVGQPYFIAAYTRFLGRFLTLTGETMIQCSCGSTMLPLQVVHDPNTGSQLNIEVCLHCNSIGRENMSTGFVVILTSDDQLLKKY